MGTSSRFVNFDGSDGESHQRESSEGKVNSRTIQNFKITWPGISKGAIKKCNDDEGGQHYDMLLRGKFVLGMNARFVCD